jgi:hypothetical protein
MRLTATVHKSAPRDVADSQVCATTDVGRAGPHVSDQRIRVCGGRKACAVGPARQSVWLVLGARVTRSWAELLVAAHLG